MTIEFNIWVNMQYYLTTDCQKSSVSTINMRWLNCYFKSNAVWYVHQKCILHNCVLIIFIEGCKVVKMPKRLGLNFGKDVAIFLLSERRSWLFISLPMIFISTGWMDIIYFACAASPLRTSVRISNYIFLGSYTLDFTCFTKVNLIAFLVTNWHIIWFQIIVQEPFSWI